MLQIYYGFLHNKCNSHRGSGCFSVINQIPEIYYNILKFIILSQREGEKLKSNFTNRNKTGLQPVSRTCGTDPLFRKAEEKTRQFEKLAASLAPLNLLPNLLPNLWKQKRSNLVRFLCCLDYSIEVNSQLNNNMDYSNEVTL